MLTPSYHPILLAPNVLLLEAIPRFSPTLNNWVEQTVKGACDVGELEDVYFSKHPVRVRIRKYNRATRVYFYGII